MAPITTALLGYGLSGRVFHAPMLAVHPGFELQKVWQRTRSDARDRYPEVQVVRTLAEVLEDPTIELVVVNTPEPTHFELAQAALQAGKHVVVEKAFTPTVAEAEALIALAEQQHRELSVYHNRRWDSDFLTVQQVVQQGLLGEVLEYEAHYDRYRPQRKDSWKEVEQPGTGILYNLGSHLIDQALALWGWPEAVFADLRRQREGVTVPDQFDLLLRYPDRKALLRASYLARIAEPRYRLRGRRGSFVKYGLDPQEAALAAGWQPGGPDWGREDKAYWGQLSTTWQGLDLEGRIASQPGHYLAYYEGLHAAIRHGQALPVTAQQARDVIAIIEAALQSDAAGQVVQV